MRPSLSTIKNFKNQTSNYTWLAVTRLDSALKKDENYYPQVFLKECKYVEKKYLDIFMTIWVILPLPISLMNRLELNLISTKKDTTNEKNIKGAL